MTLGLFQKMIDGDDALLELARLRFRETGMGAEMHAATPDELEQILAFRPSSDAPVTLHLPRNLDLLNESNRQRIVDFASRFAGRIYGMVSHDRRQMAERPAAFVAAAAEMETRLRQIERSPYLFVEYAAGLEPEAFAALCAQIRALERVSVCLDTGHIGIRQAQHAFSLIHPSVDVCSIKANHPQLPALIGDVEAAVRTALSTVLTLTEAVAPHGKPVHFHLHDGHPLSTLSPFGVSDHLSFLGEIPIAFEYRGQHAVPLMFGPAGLSQIIATAVQTVGVERASFTLEIHPTHEQLPLDVASSALFGHWRDKTNAEKMHHWLSVLTRNYRLLQESLNATLEEAGSGS